MKKKGSKSDFNKQRDAELRAAFFSQGHYSTGDKTLAQTLKTPTSRFWVDPQRARDVMSRMEKDPECTEGMYPERKRMYAALFRRYCEIRRQQPDLSKIQSVTMAIYSGAPEFYLSTPSARRIIYSTFAGSS